MFEFLTPFSAAPPEEHFLPLLSRNAPVIGLGRHESLRTLGQEARAPSRARNECAQGCRAHSGLSTPPGKKAVLLPVRCHGAAGRAVNLLHLPGFIPILRSPEGGEVPRLEKCLGGQTHQVEPVSGSHRGRSLLVLGCKPGKRIHRVKML